MTETKQNTDAEAKAKAKAEAEAKAAEEAAKTFEVRATEKGFLGQLRIPGSKNERFHVTFEQYSPTWMVPATATEKRKLDRLQKAAEK